MKQYSFHSHSISIDLPDVDSLHERAIAQQVERYEDVRDYLSLVLGREPTIDEVRDGLDKYESLSEEWWS